MDRLELACKRAGEVIQRVRGLAKKTDTERRPLDINNLVTEVIALVQRELLSNGVSLRIELVRALPMVAPGNVGPGATFQFALPTYRQATS